MEQIFVLLYPGMGVPFGLGTFLKVFGEKGFNSIKLKDLMMGNANEEFAKEQFSYLGEEFLEAFVYDMSNGTVIAMVLEGEGVMKQVMSALKCVPDPYIKHHYNFQIQNLYWESIYISDFEKAKKDNEMWFLNQNNRWSHLTGEDSGDLTSPVDDLDIANPNRNEILILIKCVSLDHVGEIIFLLENKDFVLTGLKLFYNDEDFVEKHNTAFSGLTIDPVVAMVWEGALIIDEAKTTFQYAENDNSPPVVTNENIKIGRKLIHFSQTGGEAKDEIKTWFPLGMVQWPNSLRKCIYEL